MARTKQRVYIHGQVKAHILSNPMVYLHRADLAKLFHSPEAKIRACMAGILRSWDSTKGELQVVTPGHTWRYVDAPADDSLQTATPAPSADPAELINQNGDPTFTWVGYTKQGPVVRDQNHKMFVLKEL